MLLYTHISHALWPTVVVPKSEQKTPAIVLQCRAKECRTSTDIVVLRGGANIKTRFYNANSAAQTYGILTVAIRRAAALVLRQLHEALLSCAADRVRVAAALLHRNRRDEDGGDWPTSHVSLCLRAQRIATHRRIRPHTARTSRRTRRTP